MQKNKHIHRFQRKQYKSTGTSFYFCTNNCTFKINCDVSLGQISLCNRCGNPFPMNQYSIRLAKPICFDCVKRKTERTQNADPMDRRNEVRRDDDQKLQATVSQIIADTSIAKMQEQFNILVTRDYKEDPDDDL